MIFSHMKKLTSYLLLFLAIFFSYSSQAYEISEASYKDDNLLLPIPDGYCDATDDLTGIFFMEYLLKGDDITKTAPIPKVVFTRCGFENNLNEIYPWGYIGLQNNSSPSISQKTFNKQVAKILGNSKFMNKLNELMEDSIEKKWSEYGDDESEFNFGEYGVLWSGENALIFQVQNKLLNEGEIIIEEVVASATMLNKTSVYYYITELENGATTVLENASTLIDNSKRLKRINKDKAEEVQSVFNSNSAWKSVGLTDKQKSDLLELEIAALKEAKAEIQYKQLLAKEIQDEQDTARSLIIEDQLNTLQNAYINNIAARIKTFWRYQSAESHWTAEVYVVQDRDGNVRAVDVRNANVGNSKLAKSFMDSIERAVNKASPLPGAPDEAVFDKELYFIFSVN
mgnify:FL=1